MSKVWLVTGSASGLGRNIAEAVLESGDQLVATAREWVPLGHRSKVIPVKSPTRQRSTRP